MLPLVRLAPRLAVRIGGMVAAFGLIAGFGSVAHANEPLSPNSPTGNYAWQFRSADQRAVAAAVEDMRLRQNARGYGPATLYQNFYNGTVVGGDLTQADCTIYATASGNTSGVTATGTVSSPSLLNSPQVGASTVGNATDGIQTGGTAQPSQGNASSTLTSGVSGTSSTLTSGTINAGGGQLSQVLNQNQANTNSPQTATVANSQACRFVGR